MPNTFTSNQFISHGGGVLFIAICHDHLRSFARQAQRDLAPDAAARPNHHGAPAERAQRRELRHLIFELRSSILLLERVELLLVKDGKPFGLDAAEVAGAALDPERDFLLTRQRIGLT